MLSGLAVPRQAAPSSGQGVHRRLHVGHTGNVGRIGRRGGQEQGRKKGTHRRAREWAAWPHQGRRAGGRRCASSDIHFLSTCQIPFEILLDTLKQEPRPSWSPICHSEGGRCRGSEFLWAIRDKRLKEEAAVQRPGKTMPGQGNGKCPLESFRPSPIPASGDGGGVEGASGSKEAMLPWAVCSKVTSPPPPSSCLLPKPSQVFCIYTCFLPCVYR